MKERIGLSVSRDSLRLIAVRDGVPTWSAERPLNEESLADALAEMLSNVPVTRWSRPRVIAAVGPACAQVRMLSGLPMVKDSKDMVRLVRESASRFFLTNGVPLNVTAVKASSDESIWGAAFDRPVIEAIEKACREARFKLEAVVPTVVVLRAGIDDDVVEWCDGETAIRAHYSKGRLTSVNRIATSSVGETPPRTVAALDGIGASSWLFSDAYGATCFDANAPMAYKPQNGAPRKVSRLRAAFAGVAVFLAAITALMAPGLASHYSMRRAEAALLEQSGTYRDAVAAEIALSRVTGVLQEFEAFSASRSSRLLFLRDLATVLPTPGAVVALRLGPTEGNVVFLVPVGVPPLAWLEEMPHVSNPEIVGPITRDLVGGETMARVTVRFHYADTPSDGTEPEVGS